MKRDDRQPPARFQNFHRRFQPAFQRTDFIVHRNPQRLKNFCRRMRLFSVTRRKPLDQFRQLPRRLKFSLRAVVNNRLCKPPRLPFAAKFPKNLRQFFGAQIVHQIRRRQCLPVVHPHVQRAVVLKTESAFRANPIAANSRPNPTARRRSLPPESIPPFPKNFRVGFQIARQISPPAASSRLQPRRHRDRTQTAIQSANSRPKCSRRDQLHRACRRRSDRPASASARPAPPPPSLVCE